VGTKSGKRAKLDQEGIKEKKHGWEKYLRTKKKKVKKPRKKEGHAKQKPEGKKKGIKSKRKEKKKEKPGGTQKGERKGSRRGVLERGRNGGGTALSSWTKPSGFRNKKWSIRAGKKREGKGR